MRRLLLWGLQFRLWVALCVAGLARFVESVWWDESGDELLRMPGEGVSIVFFSTLALYNLDGTLDARGRDDSSARRRAHWILTVLAAAAVVVAGLRARPLLVAIVLPGSVACALYAVRWVVQGRAWSLKQLPYFKAPFVGFAVGTATSLVPWAARDSSVAHPWSEMTLIWGSLSLVCTANALLFDLPDTEQDRRLAVPTLPARFGPGVTRRVAGTSALTASLLACATSSSARAGLLLVSAAVLAATLWVRPQTPKTAVAFWVDGALLLPLAWRITADIVLLAGN